MSDAIETTITKALERDIAGITARVKATDVVAIAICRLYSGNQCVCRLSGSCHATILYRDMGVAAVAALHKAGLFQPTAEAAA